MTIAQKQPNTRRMHNALLHRKPLFIIAAGDFEDVAFEFRTHAVAGDFVAHASLHEDAEFALVFDFDEFLGAIGGVGDVELHLDGGGVASRWRVRVVDGSFELCCVQAGNFA